jgi:hypothetical protein
LKCSYRELVFLLQTANGVRVIDSRVVEEESAFAKEWLIRANDESSLCDLLLGRCCSVLRATDFEAVSVQRASPAAIHPESNVLTFSIEFFYFPPVGEDEVNTAATSMSVKWKEHLIAQGVVHTSTTPVAPMCVSRYDGHKQSGLGGMTPSSFPRNLNMTAVTNSACSSACCIFYLSSCFCVVG